MNQEKIVFEFRKNSHEVVRALTKTWNGQDLFDLRVYYVTQDGKTKPGPKGLCLRVDNLPELKEALNKVTEEISQRKALNGN